MAPILEEMAIDCYLNSSTVMTRDSDSFQMKYFAFELSFNKIFHHVHLGYMLSEEMILSCSFCSRTGVLPLKRGGFFY